MPIFDKIRILVQISPSKWSSKIYRFQKRAFLLRRSMELHDSDLSIDANVALAKQKQNGV